MGKKKTESITLINNGTFNGIVANNLFVTEDQKLSPISEGFSMRYINDSGSVEKYPNKILIELKPKAGLWKQPVVGYPISEDSLVKGDIGLPFPNFESGDWGSNIVDIPIENSTYKFSIKFMMFWSYKITPEHPYLFVCKTLPSILIFGDASESNKVIFYKKFNKK